ncbi:hypothetical protein Tco_0775806, partial [Tanacetum coccineum]
IICEMIEEKLSSISKEKAEVETLLRDANKEFPNDDNVKQLFEQYKGFFKETVLLEEAKAQKAPQNVKPKPAAVNTKEAAEKPKPAENVKELAEKPKEPAGDDYQVVRAATIMKAEDRKEFEVESFTQWIEGNIDWVGEVRETSLIEKPVKPVNSPYMCRRIDVTARCKRVEFVLIACLQWKGINSNETVFQSLGGHRDLSSVRVNMETLAPTLWIDANVIDCWVALLNFEELALGYPTPTRHFFPTGCINQEKLVRSTRVDFIFKVNFLMLFANVMGKVDTMRAFVNLSVVRRIRVDTNIVGVDWCDFIHRCLAISHEPNTVSGFYNGPLCFLIDLEIEDEAFGKLEFYGEWSENETVEAEGFCEYASVLPHTDKKIICEMIEEKLSSISKEKAEVETLLRDANKEFPNDDNVKQLFEQYKGFFKETVLLEEAKAQKAPQNVKPKPAAVNTKEAAEKPKPAENVKELAEKPKEPAGDDYQVVRAATIMKAEDRKEFEVESFTQWIEGNIDWVGEVRETSLIEKPVKPVNSPYMCRRIDVTARCKRVEFVLGNSLFAMEGDKKAAKSEVQSSLKPSLVAATVEYRFMIYPRDEKMMILLSQFAPKKKKQIFATDFAEKLVRSTRVDFIFKVNFLMLFANVMGKVDTMRAFVNLSVVRRIHEDTNIVGVDWCDFIHRCLAISLKLNTDSGFYNGPLCFLILLYLDSTKFDRVPIIRSRPAIKNWSTKNMRTRQDLEI